jgi:hypothetical protein
MAFTVSSLTDYIDQSSQDLITAIQFQPETAQFANIITGVKSARSLQLLANTVYLQDGDSDCAFNASGATTFTQRDITTKGVKIQDKFCMRALQAKWTQMLLKAGQAYTEADLPKLIMDDIVKIINKTIETRDWTGSTAGTLYDGLIKIIKAASGTTTATASASVSASTVRTIAGNLVTAVPAAYKGDPDYVFFSGYDFAETYRQKMFTDNLYHYTAPGDQKGIVLEGSVHKLIPVHGLDGLTGSAGDNPFIFGMDPKKNLFLGVDMEGEEEKFDLWESKDDQDVKFSIRFRRGWQVAYPSEIVEYSNT